jgi:hypothetical protein
MSRASVLAASVLVLVLLPSACVLASWQVNGNPISLATGNQSSPQITSDGAGGAIITWADNRSGNYDIYAQRVNASGVVQWAANGVAICSATGDQYFPAIVSDGAGGAIVTWEDYGLYVHAQRVDASGAVQWSDGGVVLSTATGYVQNSRGIFDGAGGAIVTWQGFNGSDLDVYAQRVDASGAVQWTTDGVAICTATGDQEHPAITSDGAGGAIVTWDDGRGNQDIYAQRVIASGAVEWTADGVALCAASGPQQYPAITSDDAGGAIVSWMDGRDVGTWDIYAQRVDASGAVQWIGNGMALCTAAGNQGSALITSDGVGGAIVAWSDGRSGDPVNYDIYAQYVNASGAVQWTADGVALCTAAGDQELPAIVSDAAGGAIVAWSDGRSDDPVNYDVYAQRVNPSGAIQWTANGAPVCTATGDQLLPAIISDGAGGPIGAWEDRRSGSFDIYAGLVQGVSVTDAPYAGVAVGVLSQNYPNPFNPATLIKFSVRAPGDVKLRICDVEGRALRTLVDGWRGPGEYRVMWDGKRDDGTAVASGIYFYRLETGGLTATRKMVLLK